MDYSLKKMYSRYENALKDIKLINVDGAKRIVDKILKNQSRYMTIEERTQVPWQVVASIHNKESSLNFKCNLHNGEPLNQVTKLVPRGRGPFSSFEDSAVDAIGLEKRAQDQIGKSHSDWTIIEAAYYCESYNGWGYVGKGIQSPYVFAGSSAYKKGGYPRDHVYDPNHIVKNPGVWCILHLLEFDKHDQTVKLTFEERGELEINN